MRLPRGPADSDNTILTGQADMVKLLHNLVTIFTMHKACDTCNGFESRAAEECGQVVNLCAHA